ncbi:MAG: 4,5-DOPA dioxygenase extradiol [Candidatus Thorarchaeota archaeon]
MSKRLPALFIGHGSPMNAIENNEFTEGWEKIARDIPKPETVLCVSAHWYVPKTMVTSMDNPRTIHDFYGFPPELYQQHYPAPGAPELARHISETLKEYSIELDQTWGLDHGTWSILKKMYPEADIPIIQLSIDYSKAPRFHFDLGHRLRHLRDEGVLIIGSGNLVHNLSTIIWDAKGFIYDWSREFEERITNAIISKEEDVLIDFKDLGDIGKKAHPTLDHYLPLLYAFGSSTSKDEPEIYNQKIIYGSISMTCFKFD